MRYRILNTLCYIGGVILLNLMLVKLPGVTAFGDTFCVADVTVGLLYVLRDFSQREIGHGVIVAMAIATLLSYLIADPTIAIASTGAFVCGELVDWTVFTFTHYPLATRLLLSSLLSSPIDSVVFLTLGQRFTLTSCLIMTTSKLIGVTVLWLIWYKKKHIPINNALFFLYDRNT